MGLYLKLRVKAPREYSLGTNICKISTPRHVHMHVGLGSPSCSRRQVAKSLLQKGCSGRRVVDNIYHVMSGG